MQVGDCPRLRLQAGAAAVVQAETSCAGVLLQLRPLLVLGPTVVNAVLADVVQTEGVSMACEVQGGRVWQWSGGVASYTQLERDKSGDETDNNGVARSGPRAC